MYVLFITLIRIIRMIGIIQALMDYSSKHTSTSGDIMQSSCGWSSKINHANELHAMKSDLNVIERLG